MMRIPRWLVAITSLAFAYYYVWVGAIWAAQYDQPLVGVIMLISYFILVTLTMGAYRGLRIPRTQALANVAASLILPLLSGYQLSTTFEGTFATWYIGALGVLLAATAVRGQRAMAWIGLALLLAHVVIWGGLEFITTSGFIGAFLFVAAGIGFSTGLEVAAQRGIEFGLLAGETAAKTAEISVARAERQRLVAETLRGTLPILQKIVNSGGRLSDAERQESLWLEASLRDQIRGRDLMDARVRMATLQARQRGVSVLLLDDGGLEGVDQLVVSRLRSNIADEIEKVSSGKITVRAVKGERHLVTIVATRPGELAPDVWIKLQ
jgi:hypothetical protein